MCGIFGIIGAGGNNKIPKLFRNLFLLSESRGKEAAGFAIKTSSEIRVYKTPFPASDLVKSDIFRTEIEQFSKNIFAGIGHSRLVTNGYEQYDENNQPVVKNGMVVIHNGIIVNENKLWQKYSSQNKISELDSELIPTIIKKKIVDGDDFGSALSRLFQEISGATNIAVLSENNQNLILATNNGSIYYINSTKNKIFIFASERYILQKLISRNRLDIHPEQIQQLLPQNAGCFNLNDFSFQLRIFGDELTNFEESKLPCKTVLIEKRMDGKKFYVNTSLEHNEKNIDSKFIEFYGQRKNKIDNLKRCSKCILPDTFPNISFNIHGVCNFCTSYKKTEYHGEDDLMKIADNFRKKDGKPEILVPFSGGRDSSYVLHYVVKVLGLKPIAFSYDWGMLTDLGRRNQARMCGALGVEHIVISADIRNKRENIRKNVSAWLKQPDLGTIPLFMAGDKQYFYYTQLLKKQNDIDFVLMGENHLEKTLFKSAFSGAKQDLKGYMAYHISGLNKLRMLSFYFKQYLRNPALINTSLLDTFSSFISYYGIKHDYTNFFNFVKWDEDSIINRLTEEYDWETDPGTNTTWRIGDGTAAFYNYIYYMVAGFTENDTFRSNQIREGTLSRDKALNLSQNENQPRWDSIQWYCNTIGVDFTDSIKSINSIKMLI